jgi:hypothetical protein
MWRTISIISLVALASSHLLSGVYVLVVLVAAKAYLLMKRKASTSFPRLTLSSAMLLSATTIVLVWLFYPAFLLTPFLGAEYLTFESRAIITQFALSPGGVQNPFATRLVGDIGIVSFGILLALGFLQLSIKNRENPLGDLLPYSFGSAVLFALNLLAFTFTSYLKDLLPRGFWYLYLISAPLAVYTMSREWSRLRKPGDSNPDAGRTQVVHKNRLKIRPLLSCLLVIMILLPSMYYHYPADRYDNHQPADASGYTTVIRLPLEQWISVGVWSWSHVKDSYVYGDKVTTAFVGGLGTKHVIQLPQNGTLRDWIESNDLRGTVIVLRNSLPQEPNYDLSVNPNQIHSVIEKNNLVYNCGDPVIVIIV